VAARQQVLSWARDKSLDLDDLAELKKHYTPRGGGIRRREGNRKPSRNPGPQVMDLPVLKIFRTVVRKNWEDHTQQRFDEDSPALVKEAARRGEKIDGIEWNSSAPHVDSETRVLDVRTDRDGSKWLGAPARLRLVTGTKKGKPEKIVYPARCQPASRTSSLAGPILDAGAFGPLRGG
jgi:hypothetical protein